ncbi:MAG: hypothetical protein AB7T07_01150 [Steroidobacteraceae bacterium]
MSRIKHLQLILPQALAQLRTPDGAPQQSPVLLDWLQQGERQRLWMPDELYQARLDPWQHSLLQALPAELREHGLSSAALSWRGEGGEWSKGSCLHVEPVHLQAGLDDLRLVWPPVPTPEEEAQLLASLQPLMTLAGFDLQASPGGRPGAWYLHTQRALLLTTYSPRSGYASRLYDIMPQGDDSAELRRLMTEAQMLLHDHPVNRRREQRGVPGLNALWFWGAAPLELVTQSTTLRVLGNEPYVQGLCEHLHLTCWPLPPDARALLDVDAGRQLLVLPTESLAVLDTQWFQPLQTATRRGAIEQLDIHLDHWRVRLQGGRWRQWRRRLTRRPRDMAEMLA